MIQFTKKSSEQYYITCELSAFIGSGLSIASATALAFDMSDNNADQTSFVLESATPTISVFGTQIRFLVRQGTLAHKYRIDLLLTLTPGTPTLNVKVSLIMNIIF